MSLNKQITINEVLNAISKQRVKALITFLIMMALVMAVFILMPRKYGSEGKLFIQLGRAGTGMDPTVGTSSVSIQDSRETEIRSVVELIKSRVIIENVVREIGPEKILDSKYDFLRFKNIGNVLPWSSDQNERLARSEFNRLKKFELAVKQLEDALIVYSEKKTSVVSIYCRANSPQLVQKVVDQIMAETRAKHLEVHSVKGSHAFFSENLASKEAELVRAENALKDFRNRNHFLSIHGAIKTQQNIIDKIELELIDAEANYKQSEVRLANIQKQMANIEPTLAVPTTGIQKLSTEDSRTELFKMESELRQLQERYSPEHPKLKPLQEAVMQLKSELDSMPTERTESVVQINPVFEKVKVSLVDAIAIAKGFKARWENLKMKRYQSLTKLQDLNVKDLDASQLKRRVDIARQEMEIYVDKRSQAAVIDELDQKRFSDVVVAQPATFVVKHASPRGSVLVPMGAVLASICAMGTALYFEKDLLSGHLTEDEVEQILDIPILVSLPTVSTDRNMVA